MLQDRHMDWRVRSLFFYATHLLGMLPEDGTSKVRTGLGTGAPVLARINSKLSWCGIQIDAAGADGVGDEIQFWMPLPADMDTKHPLYLRVHWTSGSSTTTDEVSFAAKYRVINRHDDALDDAATAFSTDVPPDSVTGAWDYQVTGWGEIDAGTFIEGDVAAFEIRAASADVDLGTEKLFVLGIEFAYTPRMTRGGGRAFEAGRLKA
ncbi:MAG: hypothetical protein JRG73_11215 [Deltaproteobacteria bacterium]|nr:hypothetical protein [Deltaproteobacteria bacterium]